MIVVTYSLEVVCIVLQFYNNIIIIIEIFAETFGAETRDLTLHSKTAPCVLTPNLESVILWKLTVPPKASCVTLLNLYFV